MGAFSNHHLHHHLAFKLIFATCSHKVMVFHRLTPFPVLVQVLKCLDLPLKLAYKAAFKVSIVGIKELMAVAGTTGIDREPG